MPANDRLLVGAVEIACPLLENGVDVGVLVCESVAFDAREFDETDVAKSLPSS
jgi:putative methionine-R-sulfoxide reductase with GAF domain